MQFIKKFVVNFIKVVWANTTQMGIGVAKASNSRAAVYVVANYFPAANVLYQLKANVLPQKDQEHRVNHIKRLSLHLFSIY
jgi:hypothetical protein